MTEEFDLRKKIINRFKKFEKEIQTNGGDDYELRDDVLKYVKEFIKRLKEEITEIEKADSLTRIEHLFKLKDNIDKLAGDKLK